MNNHVDISGLRVSNIDYSDLINKISTAIFDKRELLISYANANTINLCYRYPEFKNSINSAFLIHPDGIGVYKASRFLYQEAGLKGRFTGSDFYSVLAEYLIINNIRTYFFGHTKQTLEKIKSFYPNLNVCGYKEGYNFDNLQLVSEINLSEPDLLVVGLGQPLQEEWILNNYKSIRTSVLIAVGDGIKVFAGEKTRGPGFIQKPGLEWLARLLHNPVKYYKRYVIGIPVFLCRIFWIKISKL